MRILSSIFCILLVLFTLVQYNDPDGLFWGLIYGVAALWCGLAALRPVVFARPLWRGLYAATLALSVVGVVWFWPTTPGFWRQEVWWETETAREGMGMMIVLIALITVWFASRRGGSSVRSAP